MEVTLRSNRSDSEIVGLWLRGGDLIAVRDLVAAWVQQPLHQLATSGLVGDFELARLPGQSLRLRFGSVTDARSGGNAGANVSFACGTFHGQFHFDTDQSCLNLFVQELSAALRGLRS